MRSAHSWYVTNTFLPLTAHSEKRVVSASVSLQTKRKGKGVDELSASTPLKGNFPAFDSPASHRRALLWRAVISTGAPSRGVAGIPLLPALAEEPILSCQVPQFPGQREAESGQRGEEGFRWTQTAATTHTRFLQR